MGTVNFGIMGTGHVAQDFAVGTRTVSSVSISGVGSRSMDSANRFASAFSVAHAHGSYESLVEDPAVDVVYVATPSARHADHALLALRAGKAVLVEKPFATSESEAARVLSAADEAGLFCMEAMWTRFLPATRRFLHRARSGEIGTLQHLSVDFGGPVPFNADNHRFDAHTGGAWLDRGVYGVSLALELFGMPETITSSAVVSDNGCDLQSCAILGFAGNRSAQVCASTLAYTSNEAVLGGSKGRLRLGEPFLRSERIFLRHAPAADGVRTGQEDSIAAIKAGLKSLKFARRLRSLFPRDHCEVVPYDGNGYGHEAAEVARCLNADLVESPLMTLADSLAGVRISDAVRASWLSAGSA